MKMKRALKCIGAVALAASLMMKIPDRPLHLTANRLPDVIRADYTGNNCHQIS